jgi:hypothetical protein
VLRSFLDRTCLPLHCPSSSRTWRISFYGFDLAAPELAIITPIASGNNQSQIPTFKILLVRFLTTCHFDIVDYMNAALLALV